VHEFADRRASLYAPWVSVPQADRRTVSVRASCGTEQAALHDITCKPFLAHVSLQLTSPRSCTNQLEWRRRSQERHEPPRTVAAEAAPISATCGTSFPLVRFSSANLELLGRGQARLLST
jgi:hypothetical protein